MKEKIVNELQRMGAVKDIKIARRQIELYVEPIRSILPISAVIEDMLGGLELMFTFSVFEDRIIDEINTDTNDAKFALYFEALYTKWLSQYGNTEVALFSDSLIRSVDYTQKECGVYSSFCYSMNDYIAKISPIAYHIEFMNRTLNYEYDKVFAFIKAYYLAALFADDVEDIEDDVKKGKNTIITKFLREKSVDLKTVEVKSRKYWLLVDEFMTSWLSTQLHAYEEFSENLMYKRMYDIYKTIQLKIN